MNPALGLLICLVGILLGSVIVTGLIRYTSCWNRLERLYLNDSRAIVRNIGLTHLNIASPFDPSGIFNNFRYMISIGTDDQGVYFSMIFPFRLIMRPIFIPWDELIIVEQPFIRINRNELIPTKLPEIQFILSKKITGRLQSLIRHL